MYNIGIDFGGSHIAIGVVTNRGKIVEQFEKNFTVQEKQDLINIGIKFIVKTVKKLKEKYEFSKVGIGIAGSISNGTILRAVNFGIENYNIKQILEKKLNIEVEVKNDATCACIAEYKFGNIKKYKDVLFLTLGTGIRRKLYLSWKTNGRFYGRRI